MTREKESTLTKSRPLPQPCVGIFYLINGRIVAETAPVSTIKPLGAVRAYARQHYDLWSELQKKDPDLHDLDCYHLPRGRVSYNEKSGRFEILADRHILEEERFMNRIITNFNLEKSAVQFRTDEHYRCTMCENVCEV